MHIDMDGDIEGSSGLPQWLIGNRSTINVHGQFVNISLTLGTAAATSAEATTMTVGNMGDVLTPMNANVYLLGYAQLIVSDQYDTGDYVGYQEASPNVEQRQHSQMTVTGTTDKAEWLLYDESEFVGEGDISGGVWAIEDAAEVYAESNVDGGAWVVQSRGPNPEGAPETYGLVVEGTYFNPDTLNVAGGSVEAPQLGIGQGSNLPPVWELTFEDGIYRGGILEVTQSRHEGGSSGANSPITYKGSGSLYESSGTMAIDGPVLREESGTLTLELVSGSGALDISTELVKSDDSAIDFQVDAGHGQLDRVDLQLGDELP